VCRRQVCGDPVTLRRSGTRSCERLPTGESAYNSSADNTIVTTEQSKAPRLLPQPGGMPADRAESVYSVP
jgi:hypothetical protein